MSVTTRTIRDESLRRMGVAPGKQPPEPTPQQVVADAIRRVTAALQKRWDAGECSSMMDLNDVVELLLTIADEIAPE